MFLDDNCFKGGDSFANCWRWPKVGVAQSVGASYGFVGDGVLKRLRKLSTCPLRFNLQVLESQFHFRLTPQS